MPKFAANLSMMFTEAPFIERFGAAAQAGFAAVEFLFSYEHEPGDIASQLRIHGLTNVLCNLPPAADRAAHRAAYVANLRYAAKEAARDGVEVLIEPINTRDIPGYRLNTQADAHANRERVGAADLKVQMDLYHAQIVEGDIATKLRRTCRRSGISRSRACPIATTPTSAGRWLAYNSRTLTG